MKIEFKSQALKDLVYLEKHLPKLAERVYLLLASIEKTPFAGLGKPELLRYALAGKSSRRIDYTHRLVYEVTQEAIVVYACRYHY